MELADQYGVTDSRLGSPLGEQGQQTENVKDEEQALWPSPHKNVQNHKNNQQKQQARRLERKVQDNPQYFRIDLQISTKLYEIYRRSKAGSSEGQGVTFGQKQQANNTMNYHKILQMMRDAHIKLEINQKLTILRSIKKFSFNHNFMSKEQFAKVFKVIVHGLHIRQAVFQGIVKEKYETAMEKESHLMPKRPPLRLNKNIGKLRTQPTVERLKKQSHILDISSIQEGHRTIHTIKDNSSGSVKDHSFVKKSAIRGGNKSILEQSEVSTARQHARKRIATDVSRYVPKEKEKSYLNRAIDKVKVNKVSWDSLFKMTEASSQSGICLPSFLSADVVLDDIYA